MQFYQLDPLSYCLDWESREAHSPGSLSKNKATGELRLLGLFFLPPTYNPCPTD